MADDPVVNEVQRLVRGVQGFSDEMRNKGIHLGLGSPPVCVTCGEPWPCPYEIKVPPQKFPEPHYPPRDT